MDEDELLRRRAERLRARRRRVQRRRLTALAAAIVVIVAVVLVIASAGGSSGGAGGPQNGGSAGSDGGAPLTTTETTSRSTSKAGDAGSGSSRAVHGSTAAGLAAGSGHAATTAVPVLMYHVIAPPPPGAPFPALYVDASEFAAQMQALKAAGWRAVTLDQLRAYWSGKASLPAGKPIVITFDNGYRSQYVSALPVLRRLGWVADENIQLSGLPPSQGGLTRTQVRGLVDAGWELDTQGISHADLITLDASQLHYQVATARRIIQRRYGVPVNWFCYPSGHYDATVIAAVRDAGFVGSTTVIPGWASPATDPYRLPRLRVVRGTSPSALLAQIASTRSAAAPPAAYGG
jgi:peptidoglycan/xylan/chitin deacetylase (PgdA/CDA1 family)